MREYLGKINKTKLGLVLANIFLVFFLILLSNLGVLPIKKVGDFAFFAFLILLFALYRPGWAFLFFIGTIALENINLAPKEIGMMFRPYQFFGALAILSIIIRFFSKRLNFRLIKLKWPDYLIVILAISSFVSAVASQNRSASLKLAVIFLSFVFLYFLSRIFIQTKDDLKRVSPFFLSSAILVVVYGIWQNVQFIQGGNSFETMPGRPNATFFEADWLGIFLVIMISALYCFIYYFNQKLLNSSYVCKPQLQNPNSKQIPNDKIQKVKYLFLVFCFLFLVLLYILLILTVSRSAWLGAGAATLIFLLIVLTNLKIKEWRWKLFLTILTNLAIAIIFSIVFVYTFNLTSFQLFNRVQSTGTGLQKITVSCRTDNALPEKINTSEELIKYGCRHINLEEIKLEKSQGNFIKEIYRPDPNINIRSEIYQKSISQLKKHPILGIGWGSIGKVLGTDERGSALNSSNIFLEIYLGSGIIGFLAFIAVWIYILAKSIAGFHSSKNELSQAVNLLVLLGWIGLTVANLFNAGILLGFMWVFLAIGLIDKEDL